MPSCLGLNITENIPKLSILFSFTSFYEAHWAQCSLTLTHTSRVTMCLLCCPFP